MVIDKTRIELAHCFAMHSESGTVGVTPVAKFMKVIVSVTPELKEVSRKATSFRKLAKRMSLYKILFAKVL